jgi:hypothetical protein
VKISKALRSFVEKSGHLNSSLTVGDDHKLVTEAVANALEDGSLTAEKFAELNNQKTPADVFGGVRLKKPSERYSTTKSVGKHVKTGLPVQNERGLEVETVSQLETVKAGTLFKKVAQRSGLPVQLNEHENDLLEEMFEKDTWCGYIGTEYKSDIEGMRVKTLLNDSLSGGAEVVPAWFDDAIITFPLLHSQFLGQVDLRDVPKSSSVSTASISNPTATWGVPSGTAISPFDTASLVTGIDTTIHNVSVAIEIGRDFFKRCLGFSWCDLARSHRPTHAVRTGSCHRLGQRHN